MNWCSTIKTGTEAASGATEGDSSERFFFWLRFGNIHVDELPLGCQQTVGNGIMSSVDSKSERSESEA